MIASFELRQAERSDLDGIETLLLESALPIVGVKDALEHFVVATSLDNIIGVAGLEIRGHDALLRSVAVSPEWRSRGVGRAVVERCIALAESRGLHALYLLTTTADQYFPSFGFSRTTRAAVPETMLGTEEFRSACPESATVMAKRIAGRKP